MSNRLTAKKMNQICKEYGLIRTSKFNLDFTKPENCYWCYPYWVNSTREVVEWRSNWRCAWVLLPTHEKREIRKVYEFRLYLKEVLNIWKQAYIEEYSNKVERIINSI